MENTRVIRCFIASPSDTAEERKLCDKVMDDINTSLGSALGFRLETRKWEKDAHPSIGLDGQDVINRQTGLDYDIFIGIMYQRFGTPTPRAGSGTEEEFDRAVTLHERHPEVEIMFYFNDEPIHPSQIDLDQYAKVKAFKEKVKGTGCLYWDYDGPKVFEDCLRQHLQMRLTEILSLRKDKEKEKKPACDIRKFLADQLIQRRKCHPSFKLMEISDELFPDGIPELQNIEAANDANEIKSVREIVEDSWNKEKNHLMIEGEGGIGKTVTLLSLPDKFVPHPVPAVYIQLHELKGMNEEETIADYIQSRVFHGSKELYGQFLELADKPWHNGPQILLLLDGFNEITLERRFVIGEDINRWAEWKGIQILTSSRYDIHSYVPLGEGYSRILLQPLSRKTIQEYLMKEGIPSPKDELQWNILNYPLMLTLYAQTEKALRNIEKSEFQMFRENNSAGTIIWNYLQREIWRFRKKTNDIVKCILAAEFIAPYIAWLMQKEGRFYLEEDVFLDSIHDAYDLILNMGPKQFPPHIQSVLRRNKTVFPEHSEIVRFTEVELRLFVKRGQAYSLMHQQFRDALAALHLVNVIYSSSDIPTEWRQPIDFYVLNFVSELISPKEADGLWERNRTSPNATDCSTANMLELQKRQRDYDFSELNFSGLDLRRISLFPYRKPGTLTLLLPRKSELNDRLNISKRSLYQTGHSELIRCSIITPDGEKCISGSRDQTIRVWDLMTGRILHVLEGHKTEINMLTVTPDGKRCISGADKTIRVWDLETGRCLHTLEGHHSVINTIALSPDGKRCASGSSDHSVCIWDLDTGKLLRTLKEATVNAVEFTPDETRCVAGYDDHTIRIWDLQNGSCQHILRGHTGPVYSILVTPNGKRCVSRSSDRTLRLWDISSGDCLHVLQGHQAYVNRVVLTPDGQRCISGSDDCTLRVWDLQTGRCRDVLEGHTSPVRTIAVTPNGKKCISGSADHTVRVWNLESGQCIHILEGHTNSVNSVDITPNGKRCISGDMDRNLRFWNLENGQCIHVIEGQREINRSIAVDPYGKMCLSGTFDQSLAVWDLDIKQCSRILDGADSPPDMICVSPDGKRCVGRIGNGGLYVWDLDNGRSRPLLNVHNGSIEIITITPDGKSCICGLDDGTLRVWNLENGQCIHKLMKHDKYASAVAIATHGRTCVCGFNDGKLQVWDLETGHHKRFLRGHSQDILSISITTDGKKCLSWSEDESVRVWNLENGSCIQVQYNFRMAVAFSPDGRLCVGGKKPHVLSHDYNLEICDLETGQRHILSEEEHVESLVFTPDGQRVVASTWNGLKIWDLRTRRLIYRNPWYFSRSFITPDGKKCICFSSNDTLSVLEIERGSEFTIKILPLFVLDLDFSKSIIPDDLKETLRQNGAIVST